MAYLSRDKGGGWDQIALIRYVWPWAKHVTLAHDSYTCKKFSNTHAFPTVSFVTATIIYIKSIRVIKSIMNLFYTNMTFAYFRDEKKNLEIS